MGSYNNRDAEDTYFVSLWWRVRLAKSTEQTCKISWRLCDIVLTNSRLRPLWECVHKIVSDRNNNDDNNNNILWLLSCLQSQELLEQHRGIAHTSARQLFCLAEARLFKESCRERRFIVMNRYVNVQHIKCFLFALGGHTLWTITKGTRQLYNCTWKPTGRAILWSSTRGHGVQTLTCQKLPVCLGTQNLIILLLLLLLLCNYRGFCAVVWAMVSRWVVIGCWAVVFQATDL